MNPGLKTSGESQTSGINHGSAAAIDAIQEGSLGLWMRWDAAPTTDNAIVAKAAAGRTTGWTLHPRLADLTAYRLQLTRATGNGSITSLGNLIQVGVWKFVGATWSVSNGVYRLFEGTLTQPVREVSNTLAAGSGAYVTDAANSMTVSDADLGVNGSVPCSYAAVALWSRVLTDLEMLEMRGAILGDVALQSPSLQLHCIYGLSGTGTQHDLTGNGNDGTLTSMTLVSGPQPAVSRPRLGGRSQWRGVSAAGYGRLLSGERNRLVRVA